ncbi:hypothetical protein PPYR_05373 [Photinus pyralis]|uniref:Uncharacterized protein n=1 Tax=Photinus pyralis TaxID=7054 RepID=A0A1Y1KIK2_PHOPY|nr:uncharacterized protein LOC116165474 [Photinus pyralis]KAB0801019.1 hypothetical protein PPYR_05373 [Photinus pyralis]
MLVFLALLMVHQGFGSSYLITGTNQWGFPQPSPIQQFQSSFNWPYQKTIPYHPMSQPYYTSPNRERDYEIRAIKQSQSAIFRLLKCIMENNALEYCRMLMDHMELFEQDQRKPVTIIQPIVIYINTYAEQSQPSSLPKQPEEPIPTKIPAVKFPENDTQFTSSPAPITTNRTPEAPMASQINEETTIEPYTHSQTTSSAKLTTKNEEAITEITKEQIEPTTPLDSLVFLENAEENNESNK